MTLHCHVHSGYLTDLPPLNQGVTPHLPSGAPVSGLPSFLPPWPFLSIIISLPPIPPPLSVLPWCALCLCPAWRSCRLLSSRGHPGSDTYCWTLHSGRQPHTRCPCSAVSKRPRVWRTSVVTSFKVCSIPGLVVIYQRGLMM